MGGVWASHCPVNLTKASWALWDTLKHHHEAKASMYEYTAGLLQICSNGDGKGYSS